MLYAHENPKLFKVANQPSGHWPGLGYHLAHHTGCSRQNLALLAELKRLLCQFVDALLLVLDNGRPVGVLEGRTVIDRLGCLFEILVDVLVRLVGCDPLGTV